MWRLASLRILHSEDALLDVSAHHIHSDRIISAVNESYSSFNFTLVPEGGEDVGECSTASFGVSYIGFLDVSDQGNITVGRYVFIFIHSIIREY